ncbi:hypothetical protein DFH27DRAFT_639755 [Peziza echinospora]|nr:hypothetical protein DFH27DRAFT_639755 [Peziza echinospora]
MTPCCLNSQARRQHQQTRQPDQHQQRQRQPRASRPNMDTPPNSNRASPDGHEEEDDTGTPCYAAPDKAVFSKAGLIRPPGSMTKAWLMQTLRITDAQWTVLRAIIQPCVDVPRTPLDTEVARKAYWHGEVASVAVAMTKASAAAPPPSRAVFRRWVQFLAYGWGEATAATATESGDDGDELPAAEEARLASRAGHIHAVIEGLMVAMPVKRAHAMALSGWLLWSVVTYARRTGGRGGLEAQFSALFAAACSKKGVLTTNNIPQHLLTTDNLSEYGIVTTDNISDNLPETVVTTETLSAHGILTIDNISENLPENVVTAEHLGLQFANLNIAMDAKFNTTVGTIQGTIAEMKSSIVGQFCQIMGKHDDK